MTRLLEAMAARFHGKVLLECGLSGRTAWAAPARAMTPRRQSTTEYLPTFLAKSLIRRKKSPLEAPRTIGKVDLGHLFRAQDKETYLDA